MMKTLEIIMGVAAGLFLFGCAPLDLAIAVWIDVQSAMGKNPTPITMKTLLVFAFSLLPFAFTGCQHAVPEIYTAPSVTATATALHATQDSISTAHTEITNAQSDADALAADIPLVDAAKWSALTNHLSLAEIAVVTAQTNAAVTQTNLVSFDTAVTNQTATLNKTAQQLNYETTKYQAAVGLIWKWRLWFLGLLALVVGYLFLKYTSKGAALAATIAAKLP